MRADIDMIPPTRSLIDLATHSEGDFGLDDFVGEKNPFL